MKTLVLGLQEGTLAEARPWLYGLEAEGQLIDLALEEADWRDKLAARVYEQYCSDPSENWQLLVLGSEDMLLGGTLGELNGCLPRLYPFPRRVVILATAEAPFSRLGNPEARFAGAAEANESVALRLEPSASPTEAHLQLAYLILLVALKPELLRGKSSSRHHELCVRELVLDRSQLGSIAEAYEMGLQSAWEALQQPEPPRRVMLHEGELWAQPASPLRRADVPELGRFSLVAKAELWRWREWRDAIDHWFKSREEELRRLLKHGFFEGREQLARAERPHELHYGALEQLLASLRDGRRHLDGSAMPLTVPPVEPGKGLTRIDRSLRFQLQHRPSTSTLAFSLALGLLALAPSALMPRATTAWLAVSAMVLVVLLSLLAYGALRYLHGPIRELWRRARELAGESFESLQDFYKRAGERHHDQLELYRLEQNIKRLERLKEEMDRREVLRTYHRQRLQQHQGYARRLKAGFASQNANPPRPEARLVLDEGYLHNPLYAPPHYLQNLHTAPPAAPWLELDGARHALDLRPFAGLHHLALMPTALASS